MGKFQPRSLNTSTMDVDLSFREWLLALEMGQPAAPGGPNAGPPGDQIKNRVKQAILQQSGQKGTNTAQVAAQELQAAGQEVTADPNADIKTAVEIGTALDKAQEAGGKKMMKKMKKRMRK